MKLLEKYISRGDFFFSLVLAYFSAWFQALKITTFSLRVFGRIIFDYLTWVILFATLLALIEYLRKEPLFGKKILRFFPWQTALVISIVISLLVGVSYAFTGDTTLTTMRILTLVIGFMGSVASIMAYLYSLVEKKK